MNFSSVKELKNFCDKDMENVICKNCKMYNICTTVSNDFMGETVVEHYEHVFNYLRKEKLRKLLSQP